MLWRPEAFGFCLLEGLDYLFVINMFICFFFSLYSTFYYLSGHLESHVSLTFSAYLVLFFPLQIKAWPWILRTWNGNRAFILKSTVIFSSNLQFMLWLYVTS